MEFFKSGDWVKSEKKGEMINGGASEMGPCLLFACVPPRMSCTCSEMSTLLTAGG